MSAAIRHPTRETLYDSPGPPLLYRVEEAAELLAVSRTTIYELVAAGRLGSIKIGKARRIPASALEAFIAAAQPES